MTMVGMTMVDRGCSVLRVAAALALAAWAIVVSAPASAVAFGTVTYTEPTGTVGPDDNIPVRETFTLDPASVPLVIQNGQLISGGFTDADYRANGVDPGAVDYQYITPTFRCDTFGACSNNPYSFGSPGFPTTQYGFPDTLSLRPGGSITFLAGVFIPNPGPVPAGTYVSEGLSVFVFADGFNFAGGQPFYTTLLAQGVADCPACTFTRTVAAGATPAPEPAAWMLMMLGFGAVGASLRRGRRVRVHARAVPSARS